MREVWHEGERVDNESEPSWWGQGKISYKPLSCCRRAGANNNGNFVRTL